MMKVFTVTGCRLTGNENERLEQRSRLLCKKFEAWRNFGRVAMDLNAPIAGRPDYGMNDRYCLLLLINRTP